LRSAPSLPCLLVGSGRKIGWTTSVFQDPDRNSLCHRWALFSQKAKCYSPNRRKPTSQPDAACSCSRLVRHAERRTPACTLSPLCRRVLPSLSSSAALPPSPLLFTSFFICDLGTTLSRAHLVVLVGRPRRWRRLVVGAFVTSHLLKPGRVLSGARPPSSRFAGATSRTPSASAPPRLPPPSSRSTAVATEETPRMVLGNCQRLTPPRQ